MAIPDYEENKLQEELSLPLVVAARVIKSARDAQSSVLDCAELAKQVDCLSRMIRSLFRIAATTRSLYQRPARRIVADVSRNLARALALVRKCSHSGVLRRIFSGVLSITTTADFRKVSNLLESSIADMKWLFSIVESDGAANLSLPPIASNDPILSWVWSYLATIQMGQLRDRVAAANSLLSLARDNDRNKKIVVDEGGVAPLLKLLKEGSSSADAQTAAANTLFSIAADKKRVRMIVNLIGIPIIVSVLGDSPMRVRVSVVKLVSKMAELDPVAQEEFARENVTRPLLSSLLMNSVLDPSKLHSIPSLVQINKELAEKGGPHYWKERDTEVEVESPQVKLELNVGCAEALLKLSKGCLLNCQKLTEAKGLVCLAKMIENEAGDLQLNCLMTVMEIARVAESNPEFRRVAFKPNSPAAKPIVDQLLRVIQEETHPELQIPAIKAIGLLAKTFPARQTWIVGPLVAQLGSSRNVDVATEAAIALHKFVCNENFNCVEHSKTVIELDGVACVMRLLRMSTELGTSTTINERGHLHSLVLLCYLALHVGSSKALEQVQALSTLEGGAGFGSVVVSQYPNLRDLVFKAIHHLTLYQDGNLHTMNAIK